MGIRVLSSALWKETHIRGRGQGALIVGIQWLSCVRLFATPWTVGPQAPLPMQFAR